MKKIALLLAAVMVAAMVPATAFAKTDNHVDKTVVVKANTVLGEFEDGVLVGPGNAPTLKIDDREYYDIASGDQFYLTLEGAEFTDDFAADGVTVLSKTDATVTSDGSARFYINLAGVKVTGAEAKVVIDANHSGVTAGAYTFAYSSTANATAKVAGTVNVPVEGGAVTVKDITIVETMAGAIDSTKDIKVRLYGNYKFVYDFEDGVEFAGSNGLDATTVKAGATDTEFYLVPGATTTSAGKLVIKGLAVAPTKDCAKGDVAEIVISGAGVEKTTLELATAVSYGMTFTVEDKKLPVFYAGRTSDTDTLTVTIKETAPESWWTARRTTLTFPKGVEVVKVNEVKVGTYTTAPAVDVKENVVTLTDAAVAEGCCAELQYSFELAIAPDFAGDINVVLGGPSVPEDMEVVVAEAQYPVTFEVEVSDVSIDYRNVAVGDIVITETFAGALAKGDVLTLAVDGHIELEDGVKFVIEEGDIKFDSTVVDGKLAITVTRESYKTPAVVRITNVSAYLQRSLPAGSYALDLVLSNTGYTETTEDGKEEFVAGYYAEKEAFFQNYSATKDATGYFTTKSIELAPAYIEVVTAGRDKDESTFTTAVKVTVGANTMTVGQAVVALDVPAYISNGYTMLPVRAVADALSGAASTILWDDATKTVTIAFGARIISMTIGSKVMNINGVAIAMNAAPEITSGRTFLPVRDLAYALGLTDADIAWDDATKTATLN